MSAGLSTYEKSHRGSRIYMQTWLPSVLLIALLMPPYLNTLGPVAALRPGLILAACVVVLVLAARHLRIDRYTFWLALYAVIVVGSVWVNGGDLSSAGNRIASQAAVFVLFQLWLQRCPGTLFRAMWILQVQVYVNLASVLLFPGGMFSGERSSDHWFLGHRNAQVWFILPVVMVALIESHIRTGRVSFRAKALAAAGLGTMLLVGSATGIFGMAMFIALLVGFGAPGRRLPRLLGVNSGLLFTAAIFLLVPVLRMQHYFAWLIEGILGRSLTLTNRISIWDATFTLLDSRLLMGVGFMGRVDDFRSEVGRPVWDPHNYVLFLLVSGGALLLVVVFWLFAQAGCRLSRARELFPGKVLAVGIVTFLVMGVSESFASANLLLPTVLLACHVSVLPRLSGLSPGSSTDSDRRERGAARYGGGWPARGYSARPLTVSTNRLGAPALRSRRPAVGPPAVGQRVFDDSNGEGV